jgi:HTH-like domain
VSAFRLIEAEKATHCVPKLCKLLGVSRSGYYAWRRRPLSERARFDAVLSEKIETIHRNSRATYGAPRIHAELRAIGIRCGKKRVARLMRCASLRGCLRGRRMRLTHRLALQQAAAPDLVGRNLATEAPDKLWVADITYVRSREGFLYLAFILDACSRTQGGRLVDGNSPENRAGGRCPADGDRQKDACSGAGSPFRPRGAVHLAVFRKEARGSGASAVDGSGGLSI